MALKLHDTMTGELVDLTPRDSGQVGIYACGPTVYSRVHVGNARPFVTFSLLRRLLVHDGLDVKLVMNVTDINDKIYRAARAAGVGSAQLAAQMTARYVQDTDRLELGRPDAEPKATASIGQIVALIEDLVEAGAAYASGGDVYLEVAKDPRYGTLSNRQVADMVSQGEADDISARKRSPHDFALWKATKDGEDESWPSPWGPGRPGWHIECSAMAEAELGVGFDIHGGGNDLAFPHHEDEACQTRCARGAELARIWMHTGMLTMNGEKMAKSEGNVQALHEALDEHGRDTLIMLFASGHYRHPLEWSQRSLAEAQAKVTRFCEAARHLVDGPSADWSAALKERFFASLRDDFNTPAALAVAFDWVRQANRSATPVGRQDLWEMLDVLALGNLLDADKSEPQAHDLDLLERREAARRARDWAAADALRDELAARGWQVRDSPSGPELVAAR